MNPILLKIIGVVGVIGGAIALYFSGVSEAMVATIVAATFVLAGLVAILFKPKV